MKALRYLITKIQKQYLKVYNSPPSLMLNRVKIRPIFKVVRRLDISSGSSDV